MIYLDNAATTAPNAEAIEKNKDLYEFNYFNPSALYRGGIGVKSRIEEARAQVAAYFPKDYEVVFTSCGSESDNMAIFSSCKRGNFVTTEGEHSAVYESFKALKNRNSDVRFAKLNKDGSVNAEHLLSIIDEKTSFVSVVHVNNETGAINNINELAKLVKAKNSSVIFHSDGVQAFGKLSFTMSRDIDLYSISAHKIGGVKGVGALIKNKKLKLTPLIYGGGQEGGLRSGTENAFGIAVFGFMSNKKHNKIKDNFNKILDLKNKFLNCMNNENIITISDENASPYILCLSAKGLRGEVIQHMLEEYGIIIGTGSACASKHRQSRILEACGYSDDILDGALRISFSPETTEDEIYECADKLNFCVNKLKGIMKV